MVEAAAGAPVLFGATIPEGMTGPELVRNMMERGNEIGFNVLRTWAHPVTAQYALQPKAGEYNEAAFQGLDYVLDEARKNDIRLVLALTTNWSPTGGIPEYLRFGDKTDPAAFFTDPEIKGLFKDYLKTVLTRTNSINGRKYSEDPTIMAWDLLNEPRCDTCPEGAIAEWYEEMAAYIKTLDENHLVSTGEEGFYGCCKNPGNPGTPGGEWASEIGQNFIEDHSSPAIDFASAHFWPTNWNKQWKSNEEFASTFLKTRIEDSKNVLKKPLLLEEWGIWVNTTRGDTQADREKYMKLIFDDIEKYMSDPNSPLQGSMFWQWYWDGQVAPESEGGAGGLYGIYESDPSFDIIKDNVAFIKRLNTPIEGCDISSAKAAPVQSLPDCSASNVDGLAGTGAEGLKCDLDINECVRGTANCDPNGVCINTEGGFKCECPYGYDGDGTTCSEDPDILDELEGKYFTSEGALSCKEAIPVDWPENGPGYLYDPLKSYEYFADMNGGQVGARGSVSLRECMISCEMVETCESFVYNPVQQKCFLGRGQCPYYFCPSEPVVCTSKDDRGRVFERDCGAWQTYYRLDSDVVSSCASFEAAEGISMIEGAASAFEEFQADFVRSEYLPSLFNLKLQIKLTK